MGSVYRRKDKRTGRPTGSWIIQYKEPGKSRQTPRAVPEAKTRADAVAILKEVERQIAAGVPEAVTVADWAERWTAHRKARGLTSRTTANVLRNYILPEWGERELGSITRREVLDWVRGMELRNLAPRTVRLYHALARSMWADAVAEELIDEHPFGLRRHQLPKAKPAPHTRDVKGAYATGQVEALLAVPGLPVARRTFYAAMFLTGCRVGEVRALKWGDIDPSRHPLPRLEVRRSGSRETTKTGNVRHAPIHPLLQAALGEWREDWERERGRAPRGDDWVFPAKKDVGNHVADSVVHRWWVRDVEAAGVPYHRRHDTRGTFLTLAREGGARAVDAMEITHSPADMLRVYSRMSWAGLCEVVTAIGVRDTRREVVEIVRTGTGGVEVAAFGAADGGDDMENINEINDRGEGGRLLIEAALGVDVGDSVHRRHSLRLVGAHNDPNAAHAASKSTAVAPRLRLAIALLRADRIDEAAAHLCALLDDIEG